MRILAGIVLFAYFGFCGYALFKDNFVTPKFRAGDCISEVTLNGRINTYVIKKISAMDKSDYEIFTVKIGQHRFDDEPDYYTLSISYVNEKYTRVQCP